MPVRPGAARRQTVREELRQALRQGAASARELSKRVGISEREVAEHLEHLARSAPARGERLLREGPLCLGCEYAFPGRTRFTRPGGCPRCRGHRITRPLFRLEPR